MRRRRDRVLAAACAFAAFLGLVLLFALIADLVRLGGPRLSLSFLLDAPEEAGRRGGIAPILVSTAALLGVCLAVTVPLGLGVAAFLSEGTRAGSALARRLGLALDVLAGVPSIVFGLFGAAFFGGTLGLGFSLLSGGLTLACMTLPFFARAAEEGLVSVPASRRLAAAALGFSRLTTFRRVLLPAAAPALAAAAVLSVGRALAETAALLFTSGFVTRMPRSLLDSGRSLSVHVFDLAMHVPGGAAPASASALVLIAAVLAADLLVGGIGRRLLAGMGGR